MIGPARSNARPANTGAVAFMLSSLRCRARGPRSRRSAVVPCDMSTAELLRRGDSFVIIGRVARDLGCFELSECLAQRGSLVLSDLLDEVHERGAAATDLVGLLQRVDHQTGDQLVAGVDGCVAMGAIVALLHDQILL